MELFLYEDDCLDSSSIKTCFCVGPENCGDATCPQVQAYLKRKKCLHRKIYGSEEKTGPNIIDLLIRCLKDCTKEKQGNGE